jgi:hypothetical protein
MSCEDHTLNIQVDARWRRDVVEAHRVWTREFPREPGQIGGTITALIEGPPICKPPTVSTYSDFAAVRFLSVDSRFVEFLRRRGIPFEEN